MAGLLRLAVSDILLTASPSLQAQAAFAQQVLKIASSFSPIQISKFEPLVTPNPTSHSVTQNFISFRRSPDDPRRYICAITSVNMTSHKCLVGCVEMLGNGALQIRALPVNRRIFRSSKRFSHDITDSQRRKSIRSSILNSQWPLVKSKWNLPGWKQVQFHVRRERWKVVMPGVKASSETHKLFGNRSKLNHLEIDF